VEKKTTNLIWIVLAIIFGIAGIIFFLLTEDMRLPMVTFDIWTIVNAIFFAMVILSLLLAFGKEKNKEYKGAEAGRMVLFGH